MVVEAGDQVTCLDARCLDGDFGIEAEQDRIEKNLEERLVLLIRVSSSVLIHKTRYQQLLLRLPVHLQWLVVARQPLQLMSGSRG